MSRPAMRPRFEVMVSLSPEGLMERLRSRLADEDAPCRGHVTSRHVDLVIGKKDHHFWSPRLSVELEPHGEETLIRGRFGPEPHVWTMFMAVYGSCLFIAFAASMFGISQWLVDHNPWGLWLVPAALFLWAFAYGGAFVGQGLGATQMVQLWSFLHGALEGVLPADFDPNEGA